MTVKNRVTSVAVVVAAMAMTAIGRAEGPGFATVGDDLPPLVLGNHKDCCDSAVPEGSARRLPRLPVPPQCQPVPQQQPTPTREAPHRAAKPHHLSNKLTTGSPAEQSAALPRKGESEFAQPADVGSLFSEERARRLDRLTTLLEELNHRLDQQAGLHDGNGTAPSDSPPQTPNDETVLEPLPSVELPESPDIAEPLPERSSDPVPAPREPAPLNAEPSGPENLPDRGPEPDGPESGVSESDVPKSDTPEFNPAASAGSSGTQPYVADLPPVPPIGPTETETVSVATPQPPIPQDTALESPTDESAPVMMKPVDEGALRWMKQTAIDAPVDRLALADNLYAAGETATALKVYSEIDPKTLSEDDRHWYEMQLAGCHRRLGDLEEAAKHYRLLVTVEKPAWMADLSRWWLVVLDRRESMTRQSAQLDAFIQQLKDQVHDETQP